MSDEKEDKAKVDAGDEQEPIQAIMEDPETMEWLQEKGKHSKEDGANQSISEILKDPEMQQWILTNKRQQHKGDVKDTTIESILEHPETRDWLAKKGGNLQIMEGGEEIIQGILDDAETQQWLLARNNGNKYKAKDKNTIREILDDPETRDWILKKAAKEANLRESAFLSYLEDSAPEESIPEPTNGSGVPDLRRRAQQANEEAPNPPQPLTRQQRLPMPETQPGAYSGAPDQELLRRNNIQPSHVGIVPEEEARAEQNGRQLAELGTEGLAVAEAVNNEDRPDLPFAETWSRRERKKCCPLWTSPGCRIGLGLLLFLVVGAFAIAFFNDNSAGEGGAAAGPIERIHAWLPEDTKKEIQFSTSSPQALAYNWTINDPFLDQYSDWRVRQRFALATFFFAMNGDSWHQNDGWLEYDVHECYWSMFDNPKSFMLLGEGPVNEIIDPLVEEFPHLNPCLEDLEAQNWTGRVQLMSFGLYGLSGSIPPEIGLLESLRAFIVFAEDEFHGTLPTTFGKLTELGLLILALVDLTGTIPTEVGMLSSLWGLALGANMNRNHIPTSEEDKGVRVRGTIPSEIGNLRNLQYLWLSQNYLTGSLPTQIGLLSKLERVELYGNALSGRLPSEVGSVTALTNLNLSINSIEGTLPSELGQLTLLKQLGLTSKDSISSINGTLPSELGNMAALESVSLHGNELTGTIPSEFGQLSSMVYFNLKYNKIRGPLPSELGLMTSLQKLRLYSNYIDGTLPSEVGLMTSLTALWFAQNDISGTLPSELGNANNLRSVDASDNNISGPIPSEIGVLTSLTQLWLDGNQISGTFPSWIGRATSLEEIYLTHNKMQGSLPTEIQLLANLALFDVSNNTLTGPFPSWISLMPSLTDLGLDYNHFD